MKNNVTYLFKKHIASNDIEHISYCGQACNDKNSVFMLDDYVENDICPMCLKVISELTCDNCLSNEDGLCDTMNAVIHQKQHACFMHTRENNE